MKIIKDIEASYTHRYPFRIHERNTVMSLADYGITLGFSSRITEMHIDSMSDKTSLFSELFCWNISQNSAPPVIQIVLE
jgi:hypothetical protein